MTSPVLGDPQALLVSNKVQPLVGPLGQGSQITIVNFDLTGNLYLGYSPSIAPGGPDSIVVPPLGSSVVDASRRTFIVSNTALPIAGQLIPGAAQWTASPAQIATQISLAGIPSIDVPTGVYFNINQTIAAGASFTIPSQLSVSKFQSWFATMFCTATSSGLGNNPNTKFTMQWSVASDGFDPLITHDWEVANTPFNFFYNYRNDCQGPVFGDSLNMTWKNYDSQPVNMTIGFFGSYRTRVRPKLVGRYHWITATGVPDDTRGLGSDGIAEIYNPVVPISPGFGATSDLMNLVDGPALISGFITTAAAGVYDALIAITVSSGTSFPPINIRMTGTLAAAGNVYLPPTPIMLPRRVCNIALNNLSDAVSNITAGQFIVITQEQPE